MLFRAWTDEQRLVAPSSGRFFHPCFGESKSDGSNGSSIFLMKPQKLMGFRIWGRFFLRHESKDVFFLGSGCQKELGRLAVVLFHEILIVSSHRVLLGWLDRQRWPK